MVSIKSTVRIYVGLGVLDDLCEVGNLWISFYSPLPSWEATTKMLLIG